MITPIRVALTLLLIVLTPLLVSSPAQADQSDVVQVARAELAKNVSERNADNVPRYNYGRGAIAPYALLSPQPWSMTFASWVVQQAGYKEHLRGKVTVAIRGGRAVASVAAMTAASRKAGKLRNSPRPGYLAMFGDMHVEIVETVKNGKVRTSIGGNSGDRIQRSFGASGITHYVAPW